ncbi:ATP-binding protein [Methanolapillus ohkumae]|uniref:ATP-binding protein n=1 Tax=Methanolapillus ohkumae TaxID=3028298 RepID=A0AA96V4U6_9EURY|nr:hypothetical protein MsAm2_03910 [Methanosarcinaceae archaeon Am2]
MDDIDLPPSAPILMESIRSIGYTTEAAVADIIDNSISANAENVKIRFSPFGTEPFIAILDDGEGMNSDELNEAMRYGSTSPLLQRKDNDLGRFGLGLKTASMSQCRCLTVATKKNSKIEARCWDLDYINKTGKWTLRNLEENEQRKLPLIDELKKLKNGTVVIWTKIDRLIIGLDDTSIERAFSDKMDNVREHIALVFHRYISGEFGLQKIKIYLNENIIEANDPFFTKNSLVTQDDEKIRIDRSVVDIRSYVLPHPSKLTKEELEALGGKEGLRKNQGFYVYRNKRLLVWATWFRLHRKEEMSKLSRIRVDIPNSLDDLWTLDIKKSTAIPPEIVRKNLKRIVNNNSTHSKRTWTYRGKKETDDELIHLWDRISEREGIRYEINKKYPLVQIIKEKMDKDSLKLFDRFLDMIGSNIPLNALYADLNNDEKFLMDDEELILKQLKTLLFNIISADDQSFEEKIEIINVLKITEPYGSYPDEFERILQDARR